MRAIRPINAALVVLLTAAIVPGLAARPAEAVDTCSTPAKTVSDADPGAARETTVVLPSGTVAVAVPQVIEIDVGSGGSSIDEDVTLTTPYNRSVVQACSNGLWFDVDTDYRYRPNRTPAHITWQLGHLQMPAHKLARFYVRYLVGPEAGSNTEPTQPENRWFRSRAGGLDSGRVNLSVGGLALSGVTPPTGCAIDGTAVQTCDVRVNVHNYADQPAPLLLFSWAMHQNCPDCREVYDDETIRTDDGTQKFGVGSRIEMVGTVPAAGDLALPIHVIHQGRDVPAVNGLLALRPFVLLDRIGWATYGQTFDVDYSNAGSRSVDADQSGERCTSPSTISAAPTGAASVHVRLPSVVGAAANTQTVAVRIRSGAAAVRGHVRLVSRFPITDSPVAQRCVDGLWKDQRSSYSFTQGRPRPVQAVFRLGSIDLPPHHVLTMPVRYTLRVGTREQSMPRAPRDFWFRAKVGSLPSKGSTMRIAGFDIVRAAPQKGCAINGTSVRECAVRFTIRNRSGQSAPLWLGTYAEHAYCDRCNTRGRYKEVLHILGHRYVADEGHGGFIYLRHVPKRKTFSVRIHVTMHGKHKRIADGIVFIRPDFEHFGDALGADYNLDGYAHYNSRGYRITPPD